MKIHPSKSSSLLVRSVAAFGMTLVLPVALSASVIFEANFNGPGTSTGGSGDLVEFGGTGTLLSNTDSTTSIDSTPTMGQGSFAHVVNGSSASFRVGRLADFTPSSVGNSFAAMSTVGASTVSLHGGFDFFTRINSVSSGFTDVQNWFRPFDIGTSAEGSGGIRVIFNTLNNNTLRLQFLTESGGITGGQGPGTAFLDVNYALYSGSPIEHHLGVTFSTNSGTGEVTMKIFGQEGNGAIDTTSGELGSMTFSIDSSIVTAGLPSGTFQMQTGWYGTANNISTDIDYDALRLYNAAPSSFSAVPEASTSTLWIGFVALTFAGIFPRKRRTR